MTQTPEQRVTEVRTYFENPNSNFLPLTRMYAAQVLAAADAYQGNLTQLEADLEATDANPDLSEDRRRRHRAILLAAWEHRQHGAFHPLDVQADALLEGVKRQLVAPKLDPDSSVAHARLQAAERQVKLTLESVPVSELEAELRELAASDELPDVRYLLVTTTWASDYLRRRGAAAADFEADRPELLRPLLPDWAVRLADELPHLEKAATVPALLHELFDAERKRRGMPLTTLPPESVALRN